jgi:hypothetical protein
MIESPYHPQEVDSLYQFNPQDDYLMTNAEILGNKEKRRGLIEVRRILN